jgi:rfaE bifunctional protein nucleotidyltransferase chain/domain
VNSDSSVRQLGKGSDRPIIGQFDRAALLAALESVTLVTIFDETIPSTPLDVVRPDIYVKGGDHDMDAMPEPALVRSWGGVAQAIPTEHDWSTTDLLTRVRASRS